MPACFGGAGQAHAAVEAGIAVDLEDDGLAVLVEPDVDAAVAPAADDAEGLGRRLADGGGQRGVDPGRADDLRPLIFDGRFDPLGRVGHDRRDLPGQLRIVDLGQRQDLDLAAAEEADVELAALQEVLDERRLLVGAEDLPRFLLEGRLGQDDRVAVEADAGVLLGRVDDEREDPLVLVDVGEPLDEGRRRRAWAGRRP